jgi:hypothetical protein
MTKRLNEISAKPTLYRGVRFRSRMEYSFAVWCDGKRVSWEYESATYDLGDGVFYTPDFYLPESNTIIEVKPAEHLRECTGKICKLAQAPWLTFTTMAVIEMRWHDLVCHAIFERSYDGENCTRRRPVQTRKDMVLFQCAGCGCVNFATTGSGHLECAQGCGEVHYESVPGADIGRGYPSGHPLYPEWK